MRCKRHDVLDITSYSKQVCDESIRYAQSASGGVAWSPDRHESRTERFPWSG